MKLKALYREAHEAEMRELFSDIDLENNKSSSASCDLLMKKADLEFSQ